MGSPKGSRGGASLDNARGDQLPPKTTVERASGPRRPSGLRGGSSEVPTPASTVLEDKYPDLVEWCPKLTPLRKDQPRRLLTYLRSARDLNELTGFWYPSPDQPYGSYCGWEWSAGVHAGVPGLRLTQDDGTTQFVPIVWFTSRCVVGKVGLLTLWGEKSQPSRHEPPDRYDIWDETYNISVVDIYAIDVRPFWQKLLWPGPPEQFVPAEGLVYIHAKAGEAVVESKLLAELFSEALFRKREQRLLRDLARRLNGILSAKKGKYDAQVRAAMVEAAFHCNLKCEVDVVVGAAGPGLFAQRLADEAWSQPVGQGNCWITVLPWLSVLVTMAATSERGIRATTLMKNKVASWSWQLWNNTGSSRVLTSIIAGLLVYYYCKPQRRVGPPLD